MKALVIDVSICNGCYCGDIEGFSCPCPTLYAVKYIAAKCAGWNEGHEIAQTYRDGRVPLRTWLLKGTR